jgi:ectoine hydroxylase-related dioxygenase (phytanoyl-CoA dioxygenase family)
MRRHFTRGYGIVERNEAMTLAARCAERIRMIGYAVLPSGMPSEDVADLSERLDRVMARQVDEFGGTDRIAAIGDVLTARCPLLYDEVFLTLAARNDVLSVARALLGDFVVLMQQNGVINPPDREHTQTSYHRDLPYQHFVSSRALAMSALFCIDPFTVQTGATQVLPASHHTEAFPSDEVAADLEVPVVAEAGSFILFDAMLFHRAGANHSGRPRRAINHVYAVPIIAQQISLPDALGGKHANDAVLAPLLGYGTTPAPSVVARREPRLART